MGLSLRDSLHARGVAWAVLVFLATLGLTVAAWYVTTSATEARTRARFTFATDEIANAFADRLQGYEQILWGGVGLFAAAPDVTREQWRAYVDRSRINERLPGVQGIGFAQRLSAAEREAHIREVRAQGFPSYAIRPEGERAEYTSIIYLEPFDWRNQRAFGYDMMTERTRREAMENARDSGNATASGRVTLVQETDRDVQAGFLIYVPVYRNGAPTGTIEQRRAALAGYVYSPFRINDMMAAVLESQVPGISIEIFTGSDAGEDTLLFGNTSAPLAGTFIRTTQRHAGNRPWTFRFSTLPSYDAGLDESGPLVILGGGLLISLLAASTFAFLAINRAQVMAANGKLDATARKLETALVAAEAANRAKSAFLANMSHELRTPLNAVLGYAQMLRRDRSLGDRQAGAVNTIQRSAEHLLALITDILDLSKIESGRLALDPAVVDLPALLQGICDVIRVRADEKSLTFGFAVPPDLPRAVRVDEKRLRQVLLNLLANAAKFTDEGRIGLDVAVVARTPADVRLRFAVHDTGIGIAEDKLEAIFRPFEQVCDPQRRSSGTGLGLSISRELLRLMESEIKVESTPGRGSRFWFELLLPLAATAPATPPALAEVVGYEGPRCSVLVVDDTAENRAMLKDLLGPVGFTIREAADGLEALVQARADRPDLILMDVMMPVMDGHEAMRRLRMIPALQEVPIIAISASVSAEDRSRAVAAGASAFLPKPMEHETLFQEIGRLLTLRWTYAPAREQAVDGDAAAPLVAPPSDELAALYELAMAGNMRGIKQRAEQIAQADGRYRPFAAKLQQLARGYQSKAILGVVRDHLNREQMPA